MRSRPWGPFAAMLIAVGATIGGASAAEETGESGGMGAAITAGRLGMDTIYVIRSPGDVAGLLGCCMNIDSDLPMRYLGGLPAELDTVARYTSGLDYSKLGNHGAGFSAPSKTLGIAAKGGDAIFARLQVHELKIIWKAKLTQS